MASSPQHNSYRCDRCGNSEIVAAPVLYQQGTRSYSSMFNRGISQSFSALTVTPPRAKSYLRPLLLWGFAILFSLFWGFAGLGRVLQQPKTATSLGNAVTAFMVLGGAFLIGLILNVRRVSHYNREVYPRLHNEWTHTYMCRRCGQFQVLYS